MKTRQISFSLIENSIILPQKNGTEIIRLNYLLSNLRKFEAGVPKISRKIPHRLLFLLVIKSKYKSFHKKSAELVIAKKQATKSEKTFMDYKLINGKPLLKLIMDEKNRVYKNLT